MIESLPKEETFWETEMSIQCSPRFPEREELEIVNVLYVILQDSAE